MAKPEPSASGYKIGTVSKLTGISPDTLRIWERRYAAVTPQRSAGGGRLYTTEDIARLKLIRRLVDTGDTIGVVASLTHDELQERLAETRSVAAIAAPEVPCRLAVIGELINLKLAAERESLTGIAISASYNSLRAFQAETDPIEADVLVIEQPTLQAETAVQVADWLARVNALHAVIIYRFAARETLGRLPQSKCSTLRAPVDPQTLQSHCLAQMGRQAEVRSEDIDYALVSIEPAPPRRYNEETLGRLAGLSTTIKCECPQHLAELITSLSAFEKYSNECESRSIKDAELHAYLSGTASQARHMFENALSLVIEAENIELRLTRRRRLLRWRALLAGDVRRQASAERSYLLLSSGLIASILPVAEYSNTIIPPPGCRYLCSWLMLDYGQYGPQVPSLWASTAVIPACF